MTRETRDHFAGIYATPIYDYQYTYDLGGNRKTFVSAYENEQVAYFYDIEQEEPETFDNRLLYTLRSDTSDPNNVVLEERTDYEYSLFTGTRSES